MLMGLGREGSISIAYLILLSGRDRIPLGCAFGWRSGRVQVRLCPAERCTVSMHHFRSRSPTLRTTPFRNGVGVFDVSQTSARRQKRDGVTGTTPPQGPVRCALGARSCFRRTLVHAVQVPHDGDVLRTPTRHRAAAAGPYPLVPPANSAHSVPLSHSRLHFVCISTVRCL